MHNAAFKELGLEARYEALDVLPEALALVMVMLRGREVYGANVTIPHKRAVIPYLDEVDAAARRIGAVNTIVNRGGKLTGHNTDAAGFLRALREDGGFEPEGKKVVMLGAGGSARAVAYALLAAKVASLGVFNRTLERAERLASDFETLGPLAVLTGAELEPAVTSADLLVNTTSVGMAHDGRDPDVSPLPSGLLPRRGMVCDLIYRPARTRLLREAQAAGLKVQDGLPMLVYQGALAFSLWTGQEVPVEGMAGAAAAALR
jgi:shikimate dehydrogenase